MGDQNRQMRIVVLALVTRLELPYEAQVIVLEMLGSMKLKRLFDMLISVFATVVFGMPLALAALTVRLSSAGPAI